MNLVSKAVTALLGEFNLRLCRATSFNKLLAEIGQLHEQINKLQEENKRPPQLLNSSQVRWRSDEPDAGLTWGVLMSGGEFARVILEHFTFENTTIVEIGPGYGRILEALLKRSVPFSRYVGLELSPARVARLRERFRDPRVEFRQADIIGVVDLGRTADLVFSSAVFEHLYPDFVGALQNIAGFTKDGGLAVIDFIRDDNDLEKAAAWFDGDTYMRTYSPDELKKLFSVSGFAVRDSQRISFGRDVSNREITRTVIVAKKVFTQSWAENPLKLKNTQAFDAVVNRPLSQHEPHTLEPPFVPQYRSTFGGLWPDLNNAETILAGKLATGQVSWTEANSVESWRRDGFVILRGAVEEGLIDEVLEDFEAAYAGKLRRKMSYWDEDGHHISAASRNLIMKKDAKLLDLYDVSGATQALQFAKPISRFLEIIFERPALAFQSLGFYYGSQQSMHQDTAFVRVDSPLEFVASWIALEDIQAGSGELEYYVGSHVRQHLFGGKYLWVQPGDPEVEGFSERLHSMAKEAGLHIQRFLPKKGDVLIWSAGLSHGGSLVQSPTLTRKSLVTHYCPADRQPMYAYKGGRQKRKSVGGNYIIAEQWE